MTRPLLTLLALVACLLPALASAQGVGGFVSPGPLAEDHADLDSILKCTSCHEPGAGVTPARCMACHERVEEQVQTNRGFHANLGDACATCHSDHKGREFALVQLTEETFNHQATGFALTGEHAPLDCVECHEDAPKDYTGLSQDCASCHDEPHGAGQSTRELLNQCRACHDAADWDATPIPLSVFDHDAPAQADYPLHAAHDDVPCAECHEKARFVPTASDLCTDCHDDPHRAQFRDKACTDCHTDERTGWRVTPFDHARRTAFVLEGVHETLSCADCHGTGRTARYVDLPHERCSSCHEDVHEGQFEPRDCDSCHQQVKGGFEGLVIDHDQTGFPLRNGHVDVSCVDCHGEGPAAEFAGLAHADCADCHEDVHEGRFAPDACATCHEQDGLWAVDTFDHARTDYPLHGEHEGVACESCHGDGEAKVLHPVAHEACLDCHADDDPHGGTIGEGNVCETCHTVDGWTLATLVTFDHATTGWPLVDSHTDPGCLDCHAAEGPRFDGLTTDCESCHEADEPPDHYEGVCAECHQPTTWNEATLGRDGHASTGFALEGVHAVVACESCHIPPDPPAAASPECVDCHYDDDPHRGLLGAQCHTCHEEKDWMRTRFRHAWTGFSLRGSHRAAACDDCHAGGYAGTPRDCATCHTYDAPRDALHSDPLTRDCDTCHRPYIWDSVNWVHGDEP